MSWGRRSWEQLLFLNSPPRSLLLMGLVPGRGEGGRQWPLPHRLCRASRWIPVTPGAACQLLAFPRGDDGGLHTPSLSLQLTPLLPQASLPPWGRRVRGTDQCPGSWGPLLCLAGPLSPARPPPRASGGRSSYNTRATFPSFPVPARGLAAVTLAQSLLLCT